MLDKSAHQLRLNVGADIVVVGQANRQGTIRNLQESKNGLLIEIEITNGKTARALAGGKKEIAPNSEEWLGQRVAWTAHTITEISRMKSQRVWNSRGPGAWLTHRAPTTNNAVVADVDVDDSDSLRVHFEKRS